VVLEKESANLKATVPMTSFSPSEHAYFPGTPVILLVVVVLAVTLCCNPCSAAGYLYLDANDQPTLLAHTEGDVRYYPGDSFTITVMLSNKGRDTVMQVQPYQSPTAYDPSTALGVTVRPRVGDAPVTLKSLPVVAGNIGSWNQVPITLEGTVFRNASPGIHVLPLDVTYSYVWAIPTTDASDFASVTTIDLLYRQKQQTLPVTIRIMDEVRPEIISERSENMVPGTQGYLTVMAKNNGYATGSEVTLRLVPSDNVTFQMVDDSVYIGRFAPGDVKALRARIAVKEHTGAGSYPALLTGQYRDADGIFRDTPSVPLGITVSKGAVLELVTRDFTVGPGGDQEINVSFRNTGDTPAYNAQARIIGNQMLVPVTGAAALGTINPHETKTARFVIAADSAIVGKRYVIDSDVKYRDELDALMLSDKMSFGVEVKQPTGVGRITSNPVILIVIAGILLFLVYGAWKLRLGRL
jgi:hypothetical protein